MFETSITSWIWMLAALLLSNGAGAALVRFVPWSEAARQAGIPRAFAFAVAPFLLSFCAVAALGVLRGASHTIHIAVVFSVLILLCASAAIPRELPHPPPPKTPHAPEPWNRVFGCLLLLYILSLLANAAFLPLIQNDALEYATVGRLLFETRDLQSYPAMDPTISRSGFYGPWTHPPLYAALIYLTYSFQGSADSPVILRAIAPWFALSATALVFSLGNLRNRRTGLLFSLFFMSAPLFYLGASYALIDALFVLGMSIVMAVVVGVKGSPRQAGTVRGIALGAVLWTHSTAVLFLPLTFIFIALYDGWKCMRPMMRQITVLITVALIVSSWPYYRNLTIHGSLISDHAAVLAVPELAWEDYFRLARGLESWPEKIQYGLLKGWFALEAYGLLFWIMALGAVCYLWRLFSVINWQQFRRGDLASVPERLLLASLGVVACYHIGVFFSLLIGTDQMIRNERYFLIMLPCVALLAASVPQQAASVFTATRGTRLHVGRFLRRTGSFIYPAFAFLFAAQVLFIVGQQWCSFGLLRDMTKQSHEKMLWNTPPFSVIYYIRHHTPREEVVLSMRPADMYYAERPMISFLDPRLLPFYREPDAEVAFRLLFDLGVRYVQMHEHTQPPVYNSALQEILSRSDLSRLVYSAGGNQLYELGENDQKALWLTIDLTPGVVSWKRISQLVIGGRKGFFKYPLSDGIMDSNSQPPTGTELSVFTRHLSTLLLAGPVTLREREQGGIPLPKDSAREYRLELFLEGRAFIQVYVMQFSMDGFLLEKSLLGEITPGPGKSAQHFNRRFISHPDTHALCFGVEHRGDVGIRIVNASLIDQGARRSEDVFVRWGM